MLCFERWSGGFCDHGVKKESTRMPAPFPEAAVEQCRLERSPLCLQLIAKKPVGLEPIRTVWNLMITSESYFNNFAFHA